jgi:hypothetical protein
MSVRRDTGQRPPLRVRHEPPTVADAFAAARDLSADLDSQIEIAAGLMGITSDEARRHAASLAPQNARAEVIHSGLHQARRPIVVERRRRVRALGSVMGRV